MGVSVWMNISSLLRYYIFNQKDNDLGAYVAAGGDPTIPALFLLTHAGFTLYRVFNNTDIPVYVTQDMLGLSIKFIL